MNKIMKLFLLIFIILSIGTIINTMMIYNQSIDSGAWPIFLFIFTVVNLLMSASYIFITCRINKTISYSYTAIYSALLSSILIMLSVLYFKEIYLGSDRLFYIVYVVFLILHFFICLLRRPRFKKFHS